MFVVTATMDVKTILVSVCCVNLETHNSLQTESGNSLYYIIIDSTEVGPML